MAGKVDAFVAAARALAKTVVGGGGESGESGGEKKKMKTNGGSAVGEKPDFEEEGEPQTGDVMMTMGSDFQYAAAAWWFRNLDRLIHHVNSDGRVNVFYSSPQAYVRAKAEGGVVVEGRRGSRRRTDGDENENDGDCETSPSSPSPPTALAFKVKRDDFFPYSDCDSCFWTGYFASRPSLKLDIRKSGALLAAAKQLAALESLSGSLSGKASSSSSLSSTSSSSSSSSWASALDELEEAVALGQHHDAVTGTSQQHVACDYAARLARGRAAVEGLVAGAVAHRAAEAELDPPSSPPAPAPAPLLRSCPGTNASVCDVSVQASRTGKPFRVAVYNPLAQERVVRLRVPVALVSSSSLSSSSSSFATSSTTSSSTSSPSNSSGTFPFASASAWRVTADSDGSPLPSQVVPLSKGARRARDSAVAAGAESATDAGDAHLAFATPPLAPLGAATFLVSPVEPGSPGASFDSIVVFMLEGEEEQEEELKSSPPSPRPRHPDLLLTPTGADGRASGGQRADTAALVLDSASLEPTALLTRGSQLPVKFSAAFYNASDGSAAKGSKEGAPGASPSGAYIFRPTPPDLESTTTTTTTKESSSSSLSSSSSFSSASATAQPPNSYRRVFRDAVVGPVIAEVRQDFVDDDDECESRKGGNGGEGCGTGGGVGGSAAVDVAVWAGSQEAHVSWSAGPLPPSPRESGGTEVVILYSSPLQTNGVLLTDSNGRRLLRRERDARPTWRLNVTEPVAGNFYPVTALASLEEEEDLEAREEHQDPSSPALSSLSVVVDRAQGAASLADGEVQLLAHRRLFFDDFRGVTEPLNETACGCRGPGCSCEGLVAAGEHVVVAARAGDEAAVARRVAAGHAGRPAVVLFGDGDGGGDIGGERGEGKGGESSTSSSPSSSPLSSSPLSVPALPASLHLLTLAPAPRPAPEGALLLRIAHSFGASEKKKQGRRRRSDSSSSSSDENSGGDVKDGDGDVKGDDDDFTSPVSLDLNALIPGVRWRAALETTVSGVKPLSDVRRVSWSVSGPLGGGGGGGATATTAATTPLSSSKKKNKRIETKKSTLPLECSEGCADEELLVTLAPLQVRTWLVLPEGGAGERGRERERERAAAVVAATA